MLECRTCGGAGVVYLLGRHGGDDDEEVPCPECHGREDDER